MKKKLLVISVAVACLAIAAAGTAAYFTAEEKAHNVITTGGVEIRLVERTEEDGELVPFPEGGIGGVMPGVIVPKIVMVENTGKSKAWIRVKVEIAIEDAAGNALPTSFAAGASSEPVIALSTLPGWQPSGGYYYYETPLDAGGLTTALFEEVSFNALLGNEYQNCTATIIVTAQAVQQQNNAGTVLTATGWPAA